MNNFLLLGVNLDHIATLRQARGTMYPDPIQAAFIAEQAGADYITVHLREDRRHILDRDVFLLQQTIQTYINLEISITKDMLDIAYKLKPRFCCLVPEKRNEVTTEHGLNVILHEDKIRQAVSYLESVGIRVSLFIDSDEQQILSAVNTGVSCVEIHTGFYASAVCNNTRNLELERIKSGVKCAVDHGLEVNAGHGLDYHNVQHIAVLPEIQELNIGHAIISKAVFFGLYKAVQDMKNIIINARRIN